MSFTGSILKSYLEHKFWKTWFDKPHEDPEHKYNPKYSKDTRENRRFLVYAANEALFLTGYFASAFNPFTQINWGNVIAHPIQGIYLGVADGIDKGINSFRNNRKSKIEARKTGVIEQRKKALRPAREERRIKRQLLQAELENAARESTPNKDAAYFLDKKNDTDREYRNQERRVEFQFPVGDTEYRDPTWLKTVSLLPQGARLYGLYDIGYRFAETFPQAFETRGATRTAVGLGALTAAVLWGYCANGIHRSIKNNQMFSSEFWSPFKQSAQSASKRVRNRRSRVNETEAGAADAPNAGENVFDLGPDDYRSE